jgi:DNA invertase Pin-like site-specific DNA recombinase
MLHHAFPVPRVYSYTRFSTPEQASGDSYRRQLDAAKAWAAKEGLVLDESPSP